jgi:hypothetical protein
MQRHRIFYMEKSSHHCPPETAINEPRAMLLTHDLAMQVNTEREKEVTLVKQQAKQVCLSLYFIAHLS